MSANSEFVGVPYGTDLLRELAEQILHNHRSELPDLSRHVVLLPPGGAVHRFRRVLLDAANLQGHAALLPPEIGTLRAWIKRFHPLGGVELNEVMRELVLLEALTDFPTLRERFGIWPLVDSAFKLFDDLNLNQAPLPQSLNKFRSLLASGYRVTSSLNPLEQEAQLVHSLWIGWNRHLADHHTLDSTLAYVVRLSESLKQLPSDRQIYLADQIVSSRVETEWAEALCTRGQLISITHDRTATESSRTSVANKNCTQEFNNSIPDQSERNPYDTMLDAIYTTSDIPLVERARSFVRVYPKSPACDRLYIFAATGLEHEARAVDLQVRRWYARGLRNIGIVTNNRKLARRIRALLERANIKVTDAAGWALSTTSAATALLRWCQCLDQDFAYQSLLDLLKSPFVTFGLPPGNAKQRALHLEQGLISKYNLTANLKRYRATLKRLKSKLDKDFGLGATASIEELFDLIGTATEPILPFVSADKRPLAEFLNALVLSMERLGVINTYSNDDAGQQMIEALNELRAAVNGRTLLLSWPEFLHWLQRDFERRRFRPPMSGQGVELMGFAESALYRFEAVILSGATQDHLPGMVINTPFFNDEVRQHLGLPGAQQEYARRFHEFRCLLSSAPEVVISFSREQKQETSRVSPWVERISAFHQIAYNDPLDNSELHRLLEHPATLLAVNDTPLPPGAHRPAGPLPTPLIPATLSASSYQRLLDCPYQFYARDGLGLIPQEEPHDELEKSDFGQRVHRILQAFVTGAPNLPGPWTGTLSTATRPAAEELLREIARAVLTHDLSDRFSARGWLYRFEALIPAYLDWEQARRATGWVPETSEYESQRNADESLSVSLIGRIDRIDRGPAGLSIIDYKTGSIPDLASVTTGEHVQLPFYALLLDQPVLEIGYLELKNEKVSDKNKLTGSDLEHLTEALHLRLTQMMQSLHEQASLPAWGDLETCHYCRMQGLCRKEMWLTENSELETENRSKPEASQ